MAAPLSPLQIGIPGGPELLIILLIAVLLFGANKIPQLARSTGEAMGEFQKGREEVEQELEEMREGATGTDSTDTMDTGGTELEGSPENDITEAESDGQVDTEPQVESEFETDEEA